MRRLSLILIFALLPTVTACASTGKSDLAVKNLRCEYRTNPLGIDVARPRLGWQIESGRRGAGQSAYRILVASSREKLARNEGDLWDTGRVESDRSLQVTYDGRTLKSRERCHWKVKVWDEQGNASAYSKPARWEMGLLNEDEDWRAQWLSAPESQDPSVQPDPAPLFRKAFELEKPVRSARAYVTGLGYYELYLNGSKVGNHVLDPVFTRYDRRVLYVTYDVTGHLRKGSNAAGVILGNGWYNMHTPAVWDFDKAPWRARPTMLCQIEVTFADGSSTTIASNGSWKVSTGPIRFESIRQGETYDARKEKPGWSTASYDDSGWKNASVVDGPRGKLTAQKMPPNRVMQPLEPVEVSEPKDGHYVFDMGQNLAGWARIRVSGPRGTEVTLKYGERLAEDGTVDQEDIGRFLEKGFQTDRYILKGGGVETWEPRFTYHGFRYVEVTGWPGEPTKDSLEARVVHTAFHHAGIFKCSNELLDEVQRNTLWSYIGNYQGYPTDCPHREKNGWTGDAHLAAEQAMYNWTNTASYEKWMRDFKDEQRPTGELPGIVPTSGWGYQWGNGPAWDSAYFLIPWYLYRYRGDTRVLARHYDNWQLYVDYLSSVATDHIVDIGLGDWVPADTKTPRNVTSTGYYYVDTLILARAARLLGKEKDARTYFELAEKIRKSFNEHFYKGDGIYANGSQTALSCAIYQGLARGERREKAVQQLVKNIRENEGHIDTGILGAKYLFHALTQNGRADVAYRVATRTTYPSYGYWIEQGATTLWETWDGKGGSLNHIMFGDISCWYHQALAGIRVDAEEPAFKHIIFKPHPVGDLTWVRAAHDSLYGLVRSSWRKMEDAFRMEVTVPPNATATVYVPCREPGKVTVEDETHVKRAGAEDGRAVFQVKSGTYRFTAPR